MIFWLVVACIVLLFGAVVFRGAPYVPSHRRYVEHALSELYPLKKNDVLVDFGSGDGLVLRAAARRGAKAIGFELNPLLVGISWFLSRPKAYGNVSVRFADYLLTPLPDSTTVVYAFSEARDIYAIARRIAREAERLGRPIYLVSYGFELTTLPYERRTDTHFLYRITSLQSLESSV